MTHEFEQKDEDERVFWFCILFALFFFSSQTAECIHNRLYRKGNDALFALNLPQNITRTDLTIG
jgi:hypothetical protein